MRKQLKDFIDGEREPKYEKKHKNNDPFKLNKTYVPKTITRKMYIASSIIVSFLFIMVLLYMVVDLPSFGSSDNPAINEVVTRYVEQGIFETGAVNIVTGMILDYRAFDTFGELNVLFISVICVIIVLQKDRLYVNKKEENEEKEDREIIQDTGSSVVILAAKVLFPVILLFGIYIILNGHISPGGGFSGGAVIGAGLILYSTAYGFERTSKFLNFKTFTTINVACLLTYFSLKVYSFFTGANHVGFEIPKGIAGNILSAGFILPLNICVGLVVACTMYGFYSLFSRGDI